eukprot:3625347-Rhodomonas_salina.4
MPVPDIAQTFLPQPRSQTPVAGPRSTIPERQYQERRRAIVTWGAKALCFVNSGDKNNGQERQ